MTSVGTIANQAVSSAESKTHELGGKYLSFRLAGEEYGLEILKVREIIGLMEITPVPCTPSFVLGVINLRGKVIPVTDLRSKFRMAPAERTGQTCIIVVDMGLLEMGILVDSVSEVRNISSEAIEAPPNFGTEVKTDFILGMGKLADRVTILLDINKILTSEEINTLQPLSAKKAA
ncbi:MAG: chemotaxis protein CheW [candidate division FCPU426 bacterium]